MPLELASPYQDHAVVQREQTVPVWGWTSPRARMRARLAGREAHGLANDHGDFFLRLPPLHAGGPHLLRVENMDTGEVVEFRDVLVGEVWLASGQSNMEWTLAQCGPGSPIPVPAADSARIRMFTVGRRAYLGSHRTVAGTWKVATPDNLGGFSAVAYGFACELQAKLGVPVGIISSAWGGTVIQAWTSRDTLSQNPHLAALLREHEGRAWTPEFWAIADQAAHRSFAHARLRSDPGITQPWHLADLDDSDWRTIVLPGTWQSAGHANQGVMWFRRSVTIPEAWLGCALELHLGAVDKHDITFVNGVEVGRTGRAFEEAWWNVPRIYVIPAALVTGARLQITVRAYSFLYRGGLIGPARDMHVCRPGDGAADVPLEGSWRMRREHDFGLIEATELAGHGQPNTPHILFDNMIRPVAPYALRGVIWYQGESNSDRPEFYGAMLRDLIADWRRHWGQPTLAFHVVQLPGFMAPADFEEHASWARLREAQAAMAELPHVGVVFTLDLGDADNIHPPNKGPVAERLARSALSLTYGHDLVPGGPMPRHYRWEAGVVHVVFDHVGKGLRTTDGKSPRTFHVAGADGTFYPAYARIDDATVVVSSEVVPSPCAVRYAWANNPASANLVNSEGLPAGPFRSDDW